MFPGNLGNGSFEFPPETQYKAIENFALDKYLNLPKEDALLVGDKEGVSEFFRDNVADGSNDSSIVTFTDNMSSKSGQFSVAGKRGVSESFLDNAGDNSNNSSIVTFADNMSTDSGRFSVGDKLGLSESFLDKIADNSNDSSIATFGGNISFGSTQYSDLSAHAKPCPACDDITQLELYLKVTEDIIPTEHLQNLRLITGKPLESHLKVTEDSISTESPQNVQLITDKPSTLECSSPATTQSTKLNQSSILSSETNFQPKAPRRKRSRADPSSWPACIDNVPRRDDDASGFTPPYERAYFKKHESVTDNSVVRKCLHCAAEKTPQWRTGPLGPKTLCNACGVRYKSGRLVPEYRPAASPTFVSSKHSNSHRKVIELRRRREIARQQHRGQFLPNVGGDDEFHYHEHSDWRHLI